MPPRARDEAKRRMHTGISTPPPRRASQRASNAIARLVAAENSASSSDSIAYEPAKRPRTTAFLSPRMNVRKSTNNTRPDDHVRNNQHIEQAVSKIEKDPKKEVERNKLRRHRAEFQPSLREYDEIVAYYTTPLPKTRINGAPRLSRLSLNSARHFVARGALNDLSTIPDDFVHDILTNARVGPQLLIKLEQYNPSRVNVLDAVWARLVFSKYGERSLPEGILWWRELYELRQEEKELSLEKARVRMKMRYSAMESMKKARSIGIANVVVKRRKQKTSNTRISQLREDVRRDKRSKRFI